MRVSGAENKIWNNVRKRRKKAYGQSSRPSDCASEPEDEMQGASSSVILIELPINFECWPSAQAVKAAVELVT